MTDQQRYDALSRAQIEQQQTKDKKSKTSILRTPNLDKLSHEGTYFTSAYTHCTLCSPARTSILTGRTIEHTGIRDNYLSMDSHVFEKKHDKEQHRYRYKNDAAYKLPLLSTFDEILVEDHGYVAEYYGKWHMPEIKGRVYQNDVRSAGSNRAWFGKYDGKRRKHMSVGMKEHYRNWLKEVKDIKIWDPVEGQQCGELAGRPYVPDELDKRFGESPDPPSCQDVGNEVDVYQENNKVNGKTGAGEHGKNLIPDHASLTAQEGSEALAALHRLANNNDQPFSLTISFHNPHPPTIPTPLYYNLYQPFLSSIPIPTTLHDTLSNSAYRHHRNPKLDAKYQNATSIQRWTASYYGLLTEIDDWIGRILHALEEENIVNETMVIFTSDHGEMLGGHGLRGKKVFYEEASRVPLMIRFPDGGIQEGGVVEDLVTNLDLHETILDYLLEHHHHNNRITDGKSLRRFMHHNNNNTKQEVGDLEEDNYIMTQWNYTDFDHKDNPFTSDPAFMIRKGQWKLMLPRSAQSDQMDMLFNLQKDPHEAHNYMGNNRHHATEEVIGKAEHLKALLVRRLGGDLGDYELAREMERRRTWRGLEFWVSDRILNFRNALDVFAPGDDKIAMMMRKEWLYVGSATHVGIEVHNISITGVHSENYSVHWDHGTISAFGTRNVTVTFAAEAPSTSNGSLCTKHGSTVQLIIEYSTSHQLKGRMGQQVISPHQKIVTIVGPPNAQCPNKVLQGSLQHSTTKKSF